MMATQKKKRRSSGITLKQEQQMGDTFLGMKIKKRSKAIEEALDALSLDFGKLQPRVNKVLELGRKEGYPDIEIGGWIKEKMRGEYSERTIERVLPKSAKANTVPLTHGGGKVKEVDNLSTSERETNKQEQEVLTEDQQLKSTDKYRLYQDIIAAKVKLIKQKDEEIAGLRKRITDLEAEVKRLKK